jgi:hypothetical protein
MYTVEQVSDAIKAKYASYPQEFYETLERREIYLPLLDEFAEYVKSYEPEDSGDQWILFKVGEEHFRKYGYYNSWDSPEWDGELVRVIPREVTVVKYVDEK